MKAARVTVAVVALVAVLNLGCASTSSMVTGNPLIARLANLGIEGSKAIPGVGSLFSLAQAKLPSADFKQLANVVPGVEDMMKAAATLGTLPKQLNGLSDLTSSFQKAGLTTDQVNKMVPEVGKFVEEKGGKELGDKVRAVWQ